MYFYHPCKCIFRMIGFTLSSFSLSFSIIILSLSVSLNTHLLLFNSILFLTLILGLHTCILPGCLFALHLPFCMRHTPAHTHYLCLLPHTHTLHWFMCSAGSVCPGLVPPLRVAMLRFVFVWVLRTLPAATAALPPFCACACHNQRVPARTAFTHAMPGRCRAGWRALPATAAGSFTVSTTRAAPRFLTCLPRTVSCRYCAVAAAACYHLPFPLPVYHRYVLKPLAGQDCEQPPLPRSCHRTTTCCRATFVPHTGSGLSFLYVLRSAVSARNILRRFCAPCRTRFCRSFNRSCTCLRVGRCFAAHCTPPLPPSTGTPTAPRSFCPTRLDFPTQRGLVLRACRAHAAFCVLQQQTQTVHGLLVSVFETGGDFGFAVRCFVVCCLHCDHVATPCWDWDIQLTSCSSGTSPNCSSHSLLSTLAFFSYITYSLFLNKTTTFSFSHPQSSILSLFVLFASLLLLLSFLLPVSALYVISLSISRQTAKQRHMPGAVSCRRSETTPLYAAATAYFAVDDRVRLACGKKASLSAASVCSAQRAANGNLLSFNRIIRLERWKNVVTPCLAL